MAGHDTGDYRQFANSSAASDASCSGGQAPYEVPSLNLSVGGGGGDDGNSSNTSSSSGRSSGPSSSPPPSSSLEQNASSPSSTPDDEAVATTSKGCADNSCAELQETVDFSFHSVNSSPSTRLGKDASNREDEEEEDEEDEDEEDDSDELLENLANKCSPPPPPIYRTVDSKKAYSRKLVAGACDLMVKFVAELNACSVGLIGCTDTGGGGNSNANNAANGAASGGLSQSKASGDQQTFVGSSGGGQNTSAYSPEYVTPSRFCRRSSTKSWDTGSGSPEAICFSVNKSSIYISGVRVYAFSMGQLKYQLQLLDQTADQQQGGSGAAAGADDNRVNGVGKSSGGGSSGSSSSWRTLAHVSGVLAVDDNQSSDFCELRFDRPVLISANVKVRRFY